MFLALTTKVQKNSLAKSVCLHADREEEGVLPLLKPSLGDLPRSSINKTTCQGEDWTGKGGKSVSLLEVSLETWAQLDRHVRDSPCLWLYPNLLGNFKRNEEHLNKTESVVLSLFNHSSFNFIRQSSNFN